MWCQNCRVNIEVQTLLPREKSRPLIKMITETGEFGNEKPTMEVGAVTDARIKWASSAYLPQTSPL